MMYLNYEIMEKLNSWNIKFKNRRGIYTALNLKLYSMKVCWVHHQNANFDKLDLCSDVYF